VRPTSPFSDLKQATSLASDVVWLEPRLVADVSYSELMEDRLRVPVLRGPRVT
jgi:ATP dependent DNA ligase-like protein